MAEDGLISGSRAGCNSKATGMEFRDLDVMVTFHSMNWRFTVGNAIREY